MERKKYVLVADGSSDKCLLPIIDCFLNEHFPNVIFERDFAELGFLPKPPKSLMERVQIAIKYYEPDWVFIHRDAEKEANPIEKRGGEIDGVLHELKSEQVFVKIIPIRMTEAWLLIDEKAIRRAASNPNGKIKLQLPHVNQLESIADPKEMLFNLLRHASELSGRKLTNLNVNRLSHLVAENITDFGKLRSLEAFQHFESQLLMLKNSS